MGKVNFLMLAWTQESIVSIKRQLCKTFATFISERIPIDNSLSSTLSLHSIILIASISLPILAEIVYKSKYRLQLQHSLCRKNAKLGGGVRSYQQQRQQRQTEPNQRQAESSQWEQMLMCFLISENFAAVTSLDNSNRNSVFLTSMAGLRSVVCMWITVFHVYYYSLFAMSNTPYIFARLEMFALQPIMQACFYVDVFFIMRYVCRCPIGYLKTTGESDVSSVV